MVKLTDIKKINKDLLDGSDLSSDISISEEYAELIDKEGYTAFPGFCDVHVHFREPGYSYKETIKSGSASAAKGGYTAVCTMPNLSPVPDDRENLAVQLDIIERTASIAVYPYGAVTKGELGKELSKMEEMSDNVVGFSDDGRGIQSDDMMRAAMLRAKALGKPIAAHCEVNELLRGGYIHDGSYAREHGHRGICSESEYRQIERDLKLAKETGCAYHVCHISAKESVDLIRRAKKEGINVTCETAPHYLVMDDSFLKEDGRFKMNPPLRDVSDRAALIEGVKDGTIDMIATDHAPHSEEEKSRGLEKSAFGVVGLETAFPALYTYLVKENIITLEKLVELMAISPRKRFGIPFENAFSVWDLSKCEKTDPKKFLTMGRATPFEGHELYGRCISTFRNGKRIY